MFPSKSKSYERISLYVCFSLTSFIPHIVVPSDQPSNATRLPKAEPIQTSASAPTLLSLSICSNAILVFKSFPVGFDNLVSLLFQRLFLVSTFLRPVFLSCTTAPLHLQLQTTYLQLLVLRPHNQPLQKPILLLQLSYPTLQLLQRLLLLPEPCARSRVPQSLQVCFGIAFRGRVLILWAGRAGFRVSCVGGLRVVLGVDRYEAWVLGSAGCGGVVGLVRCSRMLLLVVVWVLVVTVHGYELESCVWLRLRMVGYLIRVLVRVWGLGIPRVYWGGQW